MGLIGTSECPSVFPSPASLHRIERDMISSPNEIRHSTARPSVISVTQREALKCAYLIYDHTCTSGPLSLPAQLHLEIEGHSGVLRLGYNALLVSL